MKVLVLDDDPLVRSFLQGALTQRGHDVMSYPAPGACPLFTSPTCPCGLDGQCPDAILIDVHLPGADGFDFAAEQQRKGCRCHHVAMMSGTWSSAELARSKQMGLTFFAKPFHLGRLLAWLAQADLKAQQTSLANASGAA